MKCEVGYGLLPDVCFLTSPIESADSVHQITFMFCGYFKYVCSHEFHGIVLISIIIYDTVFMIYNFIYVNYFICNICWMTAIIEGMCRLKCTRVVPKVMSNIFCMRTGNSRRRRVRW